MAAGGVPAWAAPAGSWNDEVGQTISVSGKWWAGGTAIERSKRWSGLVVEFDARHQFPGKVAKGLKLSFSEYVVDDDAEREYWFEVTTGGKKSYSVVKQEHLDLQEKEVLHRAATRLAANAQPAQGAAGGGADANEPEDADDEAEFRTPRKQPTRYKSVILPFFETVGEPTACKAVAGGISDKNIAYTMKCILPGAHKFNGGVVKQKSIQPPSGVFSPNPTSTGKMAAYLSKYFPAIYEEFVVGMSPYSRSSKGVDGEIIKKRTLRQNWMQVVKYVICAAHDIRPITFGHRKGMKAFLLELNNKFGSPAPATARKIALALVLLDKSNKELLFTRKKAECIDPCVSTTEDSWTDGKGKTHFSSLSVSLITRQYIEHRVDIHSLTANEIAGGGASVVSGKTLALVPITLVIDFSTSDATEKAGQVADGYESKLIENGLALSNVALATLDGAAVGLAAKRMLQYLIMAWKVCGPHNIARATLAGLGIGNKVSQNPAAKKSILRNRSVATFLHRSTNWTGKFMDAQVETRIAPRGRALAAAVGGVTRWGADLATLERNNVTKPAVMQVLELARAQRPAAGGAAAGGVAEAETKRENEDDLAYFELLKADAAYESSSTSDGYFEITPPGAAAIVARPPRKRTAPEPFTPADWAENAQLEAALRPLHKLTLQTEGDEPVSDMEIIYVKRAIHTLESLTLMVPRFESGMGDERKYDEIQWDACAPSVREFRRVAITELQTRFLKRTPDDASLVMMSLNPAVKIRNLLPSAQCTAAKVVFQTVWDKSAKVYFDSQPEQDVRSPNQRRVRHRQSAAEDDFMALDDSDEDTPALAVAAAAAAGARNARHSSSHEKELYEDMPHAEYKAFIIDDGIRGRRVDLTLMFADHGIRTKYPIATITFESLGCAQITEAHEERVFKFAKLTKNPLRTRLSPIMLSAFVIIRHNFPVWEKLYGIDYDRLWDLFKSIKNTTGEHSNPGGDTEEDDVDSEIEEG